MLSLFIQVVVACLLRHILGIQQKQGRHGPSWDPALPELAVGSCCVPCTNCDGGWVNGDIVSCEQCPAGILFSSSDSFLHQGSMISSIDSLK